MRLPAFEVGRYGHEGYEVLVVRAGNRGEKRIVPPAGEKHAFMSEQWARRVEISVSPTGRSVRVWVDGVEVKP